MAADIYRPAAIDQLRVLGGELGLPVHGAEGRPPAEIAREAVDQAAAPGWNPVLLDTAGRLHIDEAMVEELKVLRREVKPHHVLLVVDAMTGQDAVTMAQRFHQEVGYDGVVLTKLDGDARGGAALSIRAVTGKPIVFCGVGERVDALEPFHPDRMASRILGMGDVLSLVEKAQATVDADEGRGAGPEAPRGQLHARGLRRAAPPAPEDGPARPDPRHGAVLQGRQGGRRASSTPSRASSAGSRRSSAR